MRRDLRRALLGVAIATAASLLVVSVALAMRADTDTQMLVRARELATKLAFKEGRLKEAVLRARYGLDTNYDTVARNIDDIEADSDALSALALPAPIAARVQALALAQRVERGQAETFESFNAAIRNSLDYFLYRMLIVLPQLPNTGPNADLQHALGKLVIDVVEHALNTAPREPSVSEQRSAQQLLERSAAALPAYRDAIDLMAKHVALIDHNAPLLADSLGNVIHSGTRAKLLNLEAAIDAEVAQRNALQERERKATFGLVALLLGSLFLLAMRYVGALRAARDQGEFLRELNDHIGIGVLVVGADDHIEFANAAAEQILGYARAGLVGHVMHVDVHVAEDGSPTQADDCQAHAAAAEPQGRATVEMIFRRQDGTLLPVLSHAASFDTDEGTKLIISFEDIRERRQAQATLSKLSQAVEQSPASIVITDIAGNIEYVNDAFVRNSSYTRDEVLGRNPRILQSGKTPPERYVAMWKTLVAGETWRGEVVNRRKDGSEYVESIVIAPVRQVDGRITNYVAVKVDVTQQKAAEQEIRQLAFFDTLTNLPNRRQLVGRLEQALSAGRRSGDVGALMMVDLDHFKHLNDTRGHDAGDKFLIQVAQRLRKAMREEDTVVRLGGDEFIILAESLGKTVRDAALGAERLGKKLIGILSRPYRLDEHADLYSTTASLGVTLFSGEQSSVENLLKQADLALYKAKDEGRNTLRFFDPEMQRTVESRATLEAAIRRAMTLEEFTLHYQPQVDIDGRAFGAEALMRWRTVDGSTISPAQFIPVAEDSGLIITLGTWALATACSQLKTWEANAQTARMTISVNVSARQFHDPDFVRKVRHAIKSNDVNPARLKLELTESVIITDVDAVIARMEELSNLGVGFSLDDFGTGYSSLAYIKRMPLQQIKIDQSFVRDIQLDSNDAAIVRAILALCDSLGIDVIAEGVETPAQLDFLSRNGCRRFQGYLFGKAVPAEQWPPH